MAGLCFYVVAPLKLSLGVGGEGLKKGVPPSQRNGRKEKIGRGKRQENKTTERTWENINREREGEGERSQIDRKNDENERDTGGKGQRRVTRKRYRKRRRRRRRKRMMGGRRMRRSSSKTGSESQTIFFAWHFEIHCVEFGLVLLYNEFYSRFELHFRVNVSCILPVFFKTVETSVDFGIITLYIYKAPPPKGLCCSENCDRFF